MIQIKVKKTSHINTGNPSVDRKNRVQILQKRVRSLEKKNLISTDKRFLRLINYRWELRGGAII